MGHCGGVNDSQNFAMFFPHLAGLVIERFAVVGMVVQAHARLKGPGAKCPGCGSVSVSVHSRYERRIADLPVGGRAVVLVLCVRRFFCRASACPRRTFTEQPAHLAEPRCRRSTGLNGMLLSVALALAGRAGARLAAKMSVLVSRMTLLRLIRAHGTPAFGTPTVVGVDDFALRKGHVYATVILDMATHRPIDVFAGRDADTLAAWLEIRSGIEIITRDRAGSYADGARRGATEAMQVADRYHLWANLGEAVDKTVAAHAACLPEPPIEETGGADGQRGEVDPMLAAPIEYPLARRNRERHAAIHSLLAAGRSRAEVARELGISTRTVYRFAGTPLEQHLGRANNRASSLDRFKDHLHQRWSDGIRNASALHRELQALGWRGGISTVERYVNRLRERTDPPPATPTPPKPRKVTGWIMSDPEHLSAGSTVALKEILARCPELAAAREHVGSFANMIQNLSGDHLPVWIDQVRANDLPALHRFAAGLQSDWQAVVAGLTVPWNNGPTEGAVNRIKFLKRQMYGRANLDLLRLRILNPN